MRVLSDIRLNLPCALEELGCETTSSDLYRYILDYPDNCVLLVLQTKDLNMVKQQHKYYVISGIDSTSKFEFEVKKNPQKPCKKPTLLFNKLRLTLYRARMCEGFYMDSAKNRGRKKIGANKKLQYLGHQEKISFGQLYAQNRKLVGTQYANPKNPNKNLKMDFQMHLGAKIDYLFFQSSQLLQANELKLLRSQCEQERTEILTNLLFVLEKPHLTGYVLTGNGSRFLESDGSLV